jgi:hypothetical protein
MRNESPEMVEVSIAFPSQGFLGGIYERTFEVLPWRDRWCRYLGHGINWAGRATPQRNSVRPPMAPRHARGTVIPSTADQRSWRLGMDAMTQLLLSILVLVMFDIIAIQLR